MRDIFDNTPFYSLNEFDGFREKHFNFTYLCKNCHRSFDAVAAADKCKFCGKPEILEIRNVQRQKTFLNEKVKYRYYCPSCEKTFVSEEALSVCGNCKSQFLHAYPWSRLGRRDRFMIKLQRSLKALGKREKQEHNEKTAKMHQKRKWFPDNNGEEMPSY